jgi:hypothetical protein
VVLSGGQRQHLLKVDCCSRDAAAPGRVQQLWQMSIKGSSKCSSKCRLVM